MVLVLILGLRPAGVAPGVLREPTLKAVAVHVEPMTAAVFRAPVPLSIGPVAGVQDKLLELAERHRRAAEVECILDPDLALRLLLGEGVLVGVGRAHHESARLDAEALEGQAAVEAERQGFAGRATLVRVPRRLRDGCQCRHLAILAELPDPWAPTLTLWTIGVRVFQDVNISTLD